jgi:hypothetical protein
VPCYAVVGVRALGSEQVEALGVAGVSEAGTLADLRQAGSRLARRAQA